MLIHNTTYIIETQYSEGFINWMRNTFVPNVMQSGFPKEFKILKLLTELDNGGVTYSIQFSFDSSDGFVVFENEYWDDFQATIDKRYAGKYASFSTLLEEM